MTAQQERLSPYQKWIKAIDPRVEEMVSKGLSDAEVIALVLDIEYKAIKPTPPIPSFMGAVNARLVHWGEVYGRDMKGHRTYQNGQSSPGGSHAQSVLGEQLGTATFQDLAGMAVTQPIKPLAGILHPDELTIPFGTGGSGKGTMAVGIIVDLIHTYGMRVAILDYEGHSREWVARLKTLYRHRYLTDLPADAVLYIAPNGPGSGLRIGSFLDHADDLRIACETKGVGYAVLDSVAGGAVLGMDPKDDQTATQFATAWQRLALPMMALSHIPKNSATTDYPYGSAYWHNLARATWFMEQTGRTLHGYVARLTNRKFNDADIQPALMVEVEYTDDGWLKSVDIGPDTGVSRGSMMSNSGIARSILAQTGRAMTAQDIVDTWPGSDAPDADTLRKRLNEMVKAGAIHRSSVGGKGRQDASTYSAAPAAQGSEEAPEAAQVDDGLADSLRL